MTPDLSTWLTKQQVAAALGVSEKTVTRMAARGELTQEILRAEGQTPRPVFEPDSVTRAALNPDTHRLPGVRLIAAPAVPEPAPKAKPLPLSELRHKTFLTTDEAVRYSGLPEAVLVDLAERGYIRRLEYTKPFRYQRADLEISAMDLLTPVLLPARLEDHAVSRQVQQRGGLYTTGAAE